MNISKMKILPSSPAKRKLISPYLVFLLMILLLIAPAFAQDLSAQVEGMASEVKGQKLEGPLGALFGNQRINIHIGLEDESQFIIGLITKDKVVEKLQAGAIEDPTLKIYTDQETITEIQTSRNPGLVLKKAFDDERITYKAVGIYNKIKFKTIFVFVNIIGSLVGDNGNGADDDQDKSVVRKKNIAEETDKETDIDNSETKVAINVSVEASTETEPAAETVRTVQMNNDGFSVEEITIKVGVKVEWKNVRTGSFKTAMIIGTQKCSQVKSRILNAGESYSYTFNEAMVCTIVDGILTTTSMKLTVE